jgi:hypothetical protein
MACAALREHFRILLAELMHRRIGLRSNDTRSRPCRLRQWHMCQPVPQNLDHYEGYSWKQGSGGVLLVE